MEVQNRKWHIMREINIDVLDDEPSAVLSVEINMKRQNQ